MSACARSAMERKPSAAHKQNGGVLRRAAVKSECECADCKAKKGLLQRSAVNENSPEPVPDIVYEVLRSSGQPLDRGTREFMEERFNHDFSAVRVHTDARAAESARAVNARAYTVGSRVSFSAGNYSPETIEGRRLLAHELAHVVQYGPMNPALGNVVIDVAGTRSAEREAERAANNVEKGGVSVRSGELLHTTHLLREAAVKLPPASAGRRATGRATLRLVELEAEVAVKSAARAGSPAWRLFWRAVARRYAATLTLAATLAAADGPLPVGELLDVGLAAWMIWDILQAWDAIWEEALELGAQTEAATLLEKNKSKREECFEKNENASVCGPESTNPEQALEESKRDGHLIRDGIYPYDDIYFDNFKKWKIIKDNIPSGDIEDCNFSPANQYVVDVSVVGGDQNIPVTMFGCVCCGEHGSDLRWPSRSHRKGANKKGSGSGGNTRLRRDRQRSREIDKRKRRDDLDRD